MSPQWLNSQQTFLFNLYILCQLWIAMKMWFLLEI